MQDRLTRREVQCVCLAGEGLANKEIAARLGRSVRTIEKHLAGAYAKLGVSDRREAAKIVTRDYADTAPFPPIRMGSTVFSGVDGGASGDVVSDGNAVETDRWILPAPPRRPLHRAAVILAFAAVAGVITAGLVQLAAGGMTTLTERAPPDAVLTLDETGSTRTS